MWKCPDSDKHVKFVATAHVTQDWVIDGTNNFVECIDTCVEVVHSPNNEDMVTCHTCGKQAVWKADV